MEIFMTFAVDIYSQRKIVGEKRALEMAALAGFTHINYDICGIEDEPEFIASPAGYGRKIREIMDENNLSCTLCHAPYFLKYGQKFDTSELQYLEIVRAFECAAELGCKAMVVHAVTVPEGEDFKAYNLSFYGSLIPYAEKYNVKIAVENLYIQKDGEIVGGKLHTPEKMADFMAELDEHFTVCVDLGHAFLCGVSPDEFLRKLPKGMLSYMHLHDVDKKKDLHTIPGLGKIDWIEVMKAIREINFEGVIPLELLGYFRDTTEEEILPKMIYARKVLESL